MSKVPKITSLQSLQHFKENLNDEVEIWTADKLQRFLQIDTIILDVCGQTCPSYPKWQVSNDFPTILQKKKLERKLIFYMQINIKFPTSWFQHFGHQSVLQGDIIVIDGHD